MSWTEEAVAYYHEKQKTNPNYKYRDALRDLSKIRKGHTPSPYKESKTKRKHHKHHRKSKKSRKARKSRK